MTSQTVAGTRAFELNPAGAIPLRRATGVALLVWTTIGLFASFDLAVEKYKLLVNPAYSPSCNFNPILSCGSVMKTHQAGVFGFPNPYLGILGFGVMVTFAALVVAQVQLPRWFVAGGALGALAAEVFIHWLIFQTLYRIGALCPWCMVVWAFTLPTFVWLALAAFTRYSSGAVGRAAWAVWEWRFALIVLWYAAVVALITIRFWDYWSTHLL